MADVTQDQVIDYLSNLTIMDLMAMKTSLEDKWGVDASAAVAVAAGPAAGGGAEAEAEQTEFTVMLTSFGEKKIQVIKSVRELTGLGLKEAKDLVESAPTALKEGVDKDEAAKIKESVEAAGGSIEIK